MCPKFLSLFDDFSSAMLVGGLIGLSQLGLVLLPPAPRPPARPILMQAGGPPPGVGGPPPGVGGPPGAGGPPPGTPGGPPGKGGPPAGGPPPRTPLQEALDRVFEWGFDLLYAFEPDGMLDSSKNLRVLWVRALLSAAGELDDDVAYELLPSASRWLVSPPLARTRGAREITTQYTLSPREAHDNAGRLEGPGTLMRCVRP